MLPLATLLSALFTFGRMSTQNEITAIKSGGISLYRFMLPIVIISIMISLGQLYFNGWIVPNANFTKNKIERQYLNLSQSGMPLYNLYFRDSPTNNILIQNYDSTLQTAYNVAIEYYSSEFSPRLVKRIDCAEMVWDTTKNNWKMLNAIIRNYKGSQISTIQKPEYNINLNVTKSHINKFQKPTEEMNFTELKSYIGILSKGGKDTRMILIDYYGKWAYPFANIIVILFGVPFASVKRKGGIAIQIGAAMVIAFMYMIFIKVSQSISLAYNLDPVLSGWIANIIFFILGLITIYKTRT